MKLDTILSPASAPDSRLPELDPLELEETRAAANEHLQQLQYWAGREYTDSFQVRFPRGFLRTVHQWRHAVEFVRPTTVRNNIAYTLMMHDVHVWLLKRTDIAGLARDMLIKAAIASLGAIGEALLIQATTPPLGRRQRIVSRIEHLHAEGVLTKSSVDDLGWLWQMRNRQHLFELSEREFDFYSDDDHARAETAVAVLISGLRERAAAA